jgi:hypothetical protein
VKGVNVKSAVLFLLAALAIEANAAAKARMPLVVVSGADSEVRQASYRRITEPDEWAKIWANHVGTSVDDPYSPRFEVDFGRCMVIAILRGEQQNSRGIQLDSMEDSEDVLVIRFTQLGYQTSGADNNKPLDRPYAFVVVPAATKRIVIEENVQNLIGRPPDWKEVARMEVQELIPDRP